MVEGQCNEPVLTGQGNGSVESGEVHESSILNRYEYDAWGNLSVCEETVRNRFKFNGQQYDSVSQQYYLRARYYNPVIGRFTQEDTYRGDGLNLYVYCRSNPVYYVDPSGHMTCKEARKTMREAIRKGWTLQDLDASVASQLKAWYDNKTNHGGLKSGEKKLASQLGLDVEGTGNLNDGLGNLDWTNTNRRGQTALEHVQRHGEPNYQREMHGVFRGDVQAIIEDAWSNRANAEVISDGMGGTIYNIPYQNAGYNTGYVNFGQQMNYVTIVVQDGTSTVWTAFPSFGDYGMEMSDYYRRGTSD